MDQRIEWAIEARTDLQCFTINKVNYILDAYWFRKPSNRLSWNLRFSLTVSYKCTDILNYRVDWILPIKGPLYKTYMLFDVY